MGSCKSSSILHSKPIVKLSKEAYSDLSQSEARFLLLLFKELCIRNNSRILLEKSVFLEFVKLTVLNSQGLLGERLFNFYDKDLDGYITEEEFFMLFKTFGKSSAEAIANEIFLICDFDENGRIDKQNIFLMFYSLISEIIEAATNRTQKGSPDMIIFKSSNPNISKFSSSTISTFGSVIEESNKALPESFIDAIFPKFATNSQYLTIHQFKDFFCNQQWLLQKFQNLFRIKSCLENLNSHKSKYRKPSIVAISKISQKFMAKVFTKGVWVNKKIVVDEPFLLIYGAKDLENAALLENCIIKTRKNILIIIYATQFDERLSITFESEEECTNSISLLNSAGSIRKFKEFYSKGARIGQGKFSEVFLATEYLTGAIWAVKRVFKRTLDRSERDMIQKEIAIHSILNHKSITKFKESFHSRKYVYIVMEYVKGKDLLKKINQNDQSEASVKKIVKEILECVQFMHRIGVVHRDLKPENIMIDEKNGENSIKIIDFGLSTYILPFGYAKSLCGTVGYSAPEVFSGKYSSKIDLWSVGVVTFAFLIGKLPFFSYDREELIKKLLVEEVEFKEEKWKCYSEDSKNFIKGLLCKEEKFRMDCEQALKHSWLNQTE